MSQTYGFVRRQSAMIIAVVLIAVFYFLCREPAMAPAEQKTAVENFRFTELTLPEVEGHPEYKYVREVHKSVKHINAYLSTLGAAVAMGDLDGDGMPNDVVHVDPRTDQVICGVAPGTKERFKTFALEPGEELLNKKTMCPQGALIADLNEDGYADVLVFYWGRSPILFLRKTPTSAKDTLSAADFVPQTLHTPKKDAGSDDRWYSSTASTADLDGDGHLDVIIGNYLFDGSIILDANASDEAQQTLHNSLAKSGNGGGPRIFRFVSATKGDKPSVKFVEEPEALEDSVAHGWTFGIGCVDFDGDMLPEMYLANDFGPDRLLHNRSKPGQIRFGNLIGKRTLGTPSSFVLGKDSFKGMGIDFGDINGDGLLDMYVSNLTSQFALLESHYVWVNTGEVEKMKDGIAPFEQHSERYGLSRSGWSWDCRFVDLNNDGTLEALQCNGFLKGNTSRWPEMQALGTSNNQLLHNPKFWPRLREGDDVSGHDTFCFFVKAKTGLYHDIAHELGMAGPRVNRGIAIGDVDGDGKLEFAVANQWGPSYLYHNEYPNPGQFLGLNLLLPLEPIKSSVVKDGMGYSASEKAARPAVGAIVKAKLPDGRKLIGQVDGGTGFSGKRSPQVHLGLGDFKEAVAVEVRWRDQEGQVREETFQLKPGWHTIWLGQTKSEKGASR